jgi:hypothetical protein
MLGQIVIITFLLLLLAFVFRSGNSTSVRLFIIVFLTAGVFFVLLPELTTALANQLGIGRGADLLLYVFVIFTLYHFVYSLAEHNRLLKMVTLLSREIALLKAQMGGQNDEPKPTSHSPLDS